MEEVEGHLTGLCSLSVYHVSSSEFQGAAISAPPWHWARSQPRPDWTDLHGCWGCKLKSKWHRLSLLATFPVPSLVSKAVIRALQIGTWRGLAFQSSFSTQGSTLANLKGQSGHEDGDPLRVAEPQKLLRKTYKENRQTRGCHPHTATTDYLPAKQLAKYV